MNRVIAAALLSGAIAGCGTVQPVLLEADRQPGHEVMFDRDADLGLFEFSDPGAFAIEGGALVMPREGRFEPRYRSPQGIAIWREPIAGDLELTCRARQTGRPYDHRDLVIVFGYQDSEHFYYAHLATKADATAHQIHIVDGADRRPITTWRTDGVHWGSPEEWHTIRLVRSGPAVLVQFDGVSVLAAEDRSFGEGRVGVGSFDDTGAFDDLRLVVR